MYYFNHFLVAFNSSPLQKIRVATCLPFLLTTVLLGDGKTVIAQSANQYPKVTEGSKDYVFASLVPSRKVTLVYVGTATTAKENGGIYNTSEYRTGVLRLQMVWQTIWDGSAYSRIGQEPNFKLNGHDVSWVTLGIGSLFSIPLRSQTVSFESQLFGLNDCIPFVSLDKQLRYKIVNPLGSISGQAVTTFLVRPYDGTLQVSGKKVTTGSIEMINTDRNFKGQAMLTKTKVYLNDVVPGRIVKADYSISYGGVITQSQSIVLTSIVRE